MLSVGCADRLREFVSVAHESWTVWGGIDPGATGAIAFVCGDRHLVFDMPTVRLEVRRVKKLTEVEQAATGKKTKTVKGTTVQFHYDDIMTIFRKVADCAVTLCVCVEEGQVQHSGKGFASAYTALKTGFAHGMWVLFLRSLPRCRVFEVAPSVWKETMGLTGQDKNASRKTASTLFESAAAELSRVADHNRAEALLLAEYGRRIAGA